MMAQLRQLGPADYLMVFIFSRIHHSNSQTTCKWAWTCLSRAPPIITSPGLILGSHAPTHSVLYGTEDVSKQHLRNPSSLWTFTHVVCPRCPPLVNLLLWS